jgi:flagellin
MASVLNTNMASISAQKYLTQAQNKLSTSYEKLSSGSRINRAQDDAAGLGITQNLTATIGGTTFAIRNANDAIGTLQTAEGALAEISGMLQRFKELATQGNNGALNTNQRGYLKGEMDQLATEITNITSRTSFNGNKLIGVGATSLRFQTGAATTDTLVVSYTNVLTLSAVSGILNSAKTNLGTQSYAASAFAAMTSRIETAIDQIASKRAGFGALVNRVNANLNNLDALNENLAAAKSRVTDTDYAAETALLTRTQILQQAATAMLSQANAQPNVILALLK